MLDFASDISRFSTSARKNGQPRYSRRSSSTGAAASPAPAPSQAGAMHRVCVHEKTHGIARSAASSLGAAASGRDTGREPISSSASSSSGVNERRKRGKPGRPTRSRGTSACAARETASIVSRAPRAPPARAGSGTPSAASPATRGLEVPPREPGQAVLERDRLALLGELEPAADGVRRLREDRRVRRASAPPRATAPAVEDGQLDTALARQPGERPPARGRSPTGR